MDLRGTILQTGISEPELNESKIKNAFERVPQIRQNISNCAREHTPPGPARPVNARGFLWGRRSSRRPHLPAGPAHSAPPRPGPAEPGASLPGGTPLVTAIGAVYVGANSYEIKE